MVALDDLIQISEYEWEIPASWRADMLVPVRLFATRQLLEQIAGDKSLEQAVNAATLPGLVGSVIVMPDMHQGYGFPIGGVAATELPHGVISPGAIGYDINCGVRLLSSAIEFGEAQDHLDTLATLLNKYCPSGVGKEGTVEVKLPDFQRLLRDGSHWAGQNGFATESDLARTEEGGRVEGANPAKVSDRAIARGRGQVGAIHVQGALAAGVPAQVCHDPAHDRPRGDADGDLRRESDPRPRTGDDPAAVSLPRPGSHVGNWTNCGGC